jgi:hypothetical protein
MAGITVLFSISLPCNDSSCTFPDKEVDAVYCGDVTTYFTIKNLQFENLNGIALATSSPILANEKKLVP